jgi:adenylate kinase family enzyme
MPPSKPPQPGRRIVVVGVSGSGKTYVAKRLAEVLGLTYICGDAILWRPNWTQATPEQQFDGYDQATRADAWTLDSNVGGISTPKDQMIVGRADTLVWLDLPRREVFGQLFRRTIRRAWTQEPMWHGNRESWRLSFFSRDSILLWSMKTYGKRRKQYAALFGDPDYAHLQRIRLTSRREVDQWLASLDRDAYS